MSSPNPDFALPLLISLISSRFLSPTPLRRPLPSPPISLSLSHSLSLSLSLTPSLRLSLLFSDPPRANWATGRQLGQTSHILVLDDRREQGAGSRQQSLSLSLSLSLSTHQTLHTRHRISQAVLEYAVRRRVPRLPDEWRLSQAQPTSALNVNHCKVNGVDYISHDHRQMLHHECIIAVTLTKWRRYWGEERDGCWGGGKEEMDSREKHIWEENRDERRTERGVCSHRGRSLSRLSEKWLLRKRSTASMHSSKQACRVICVEL